MLPPLEVGNRSPENRRQLRCFYISNIEDVGEDCSKHNGKDGGGNLEGHYCLADHTDENDNKYHRTYNRR